MCRMNRYGFPRTGPKQAKYVRGFQTGDIVKAVVTSGKKVGVYQGRVAVRTSGSFNIATAHTTIEGIGYRFCQSVHRSDGYSYRHGKNPPHTLQKERFACPPLGVPPLAQAQGYPRRHFHEASAYSP